MFSNKKEVSSSLRMKALTEIRLSRKGKRPEINIANLTTPTTPHGRFEYAFPVWRENFQCSFKFDVEVDPCVPTFGGNLGYY